MREREPGPETPIEDPNDPDEEQRREPPQHPDSPPVDDTSRRVPVEDPPEREDPQNEPAET
jgi:hypothetical protein